MISITFSISAPHNLIQYYINYQDGINPDIQRYFAIDELSGELTVKLIGDSQLDRDNGEDRHLIRINVEDNFQGNGGKYDWQFSSRNKIFKRSNILARNLNQTTVIVTLKDVNDNAPVMPMKAEYEMGEETAVVSSRSEQKLQS